MQASTSNRDPIPDGYKKIWVHLLYDAKHDGHYKAHLIGDGHLTNVPVENVHSGVVSLHGLWMVTLLAELNEMDLWATDIGNAYLEAYMAKKLVMVGGPEFEEMEGHILIIFKALYRL